jgi:hypothetical protein
MTGGLMNIVAYGSENLLFNGNPKKTFFKATYQKHTNFGLQRFRIDYEGNRELSLTNPTILDFKIPKYADLLHDTYLVINLPTIYSPFHHFKTENPSGYSQLNGHEYVPYEFRWIEELGTNMIEEIEIYSGGNTLSKYSGEYLNCLKERDYDTSKKDLWNRMTGNTPDLNNPGNTNGNINSYPNSQFTNAGLDIEPSIRGKQLYVPIDAFFCESSKTCLPLIALQFQSVSIRITLKPIMDLYTLNNIDDIPSDNGLTYRIQPNKNVLHHQIWRFLNPPTDKYANSSLYNQNSTWNADIHLVGTYVFLSEAERAVFAAREHKILVKQVYTHDFLDVNGTRIVDIESKDMVSNYMWRFRRSDAFLRNEWSNYTNWPYNNILPQSLQTFIDPEMPNPSNFFVTGNIGIPGVTNNHPINLKEIMLDMGITMDGVYRETVFPSGVYKYVEKYMRTSSNAKDGLYCYSFGLDSNRRTYQPSGAMNVNKFKKVFFEFNTISPPIDLSGTNVEYMCDSSGNAIAFRKNIAKLNEYSYDLRVFEERYNILIIQGGNLGLFHAR